MSYFMYDVAGAALDEPDPEAMGRVLDGLTEADEEHPDVSLTHESGWCLSAFGDGLLIWENPDDDSVTPGRMRDVTREETLHLLGLLAAGDVRAVEARAWQR